MTVAAAGADSAGRPGPVATRDKERVLEQGGDAPVYGPNLRASCRRMEAAGWLRTLRAPNLQLAVELTDAGGIRRIKESDPLQVASWYQTCFDAGLPVTIQVNESRD
ncbi:hypothetical protein AAIP79_005097 [Klebsiella aerogenes]